MRDNDDDQRPAWAGKYAQDLTRLTLQTFGDRCHLCGLKGATTADHKQPRSKGGPDTLENLRPAHLSCNSSRGDRDLSELVAAENHERFFLE